MVLRKQKIELYFEGKQKALWLFIATGDVQV
jgi:hypothetical protein